MAYLAISREPPYAEADDMLGGTSEPRQRFVHGRGAAGETTLEPDLHRIEAQKAVEFAKAQMAAVLAAKAAAHDNRPDGDAPPAASEHVDPRVAALPEPEGMKRNLGPRPPTHTV